MSTSCVAPLPGLGGDPLLLGTGAGVILYFRSDDKVVEAAPAVSGSAWDVTDLSGIAGVRAWHDPCAIQAEEPALRRLRRTGQRLAPAHEGAVR